MISVILVDDDEDSLQLMSQFLKLKGGVDVLGEATDGKQAVELYKELKPDVIVTDMKMPQYDGTYVINEIMKFNPNAKIIVVTAFQKYQFDRKYVFATLIKPYDINELFTKIKQVIPKKIVFETTPISESLKKVLLRLGTPQFELIESRLWNECKIRIEICDKFPSSLKLILKDTFGESYETLLNQLKDELIQQTKEPHKEFFEIMKINYSGK